MVSNNTWKVSNIFFKPSDAFRAPEGLKGSGMFTNTMSILFPLRSEYSFHLGHYLINTLSIPSLGLITPHRHLERQKPGYWVSLPTQPPFLGALVFVLAGLPKTRGLLSPPNLRHWRRLLPWPHVGCSLTHTAHSSPKLVGCFSILFTVSRIQYFNFLHISPPIFSFMNYGLRVKLRLSHTKKIINHQPIFL